MSRTRFFNLHTLPIMFGTLLILAGCASRPRYGATPRHKKGCDCPKWNAVPQDNKGGVHVDLMKRANEPVAMNEHGGGI